MVVPSLSFVEGWHALATTAGRGRIGLLQQNDASTPPQRWVPGDFGSADRRLQTAPTRASASSRVRPRPEAPAGNHDPPKQRWIHAPRRLSRMIPAGYQCALHAKYHSGSGGRDWTSRGAGNAGRDDFEMSEPVRECAVCQQLRTRGSYGRDHDDFVCVGCERDARQFLKVQDDLYGGGAAHGRAGAGTDLTGAGVVRRADVGERESGAPNGGVTVRHLSGARGPSGPAGDRGLAS